MTDDLLTKEEYIALSPYDRGYATYMQAARNPAIPKGCFYEKGSGDYVEWHAGNRQAMLDTQEADG